MHGVLHCSCVIEHLNYSSKTFYGVVMLFYVSSCIMFQIKNNDLIMMSVYNNAENKQRSAHMLNNMLTHTAHGMYI